MLRQWDFFDVTPERLAIGVNMVAQIGFKERLGRGYNPVAGSRILWQRFG